MEEVVSPEATRLNDSKENVEKVVNPPQKPVIKKAFNRVDIIPDFIKYPVNKPNRKHPITLMVKVARGKGAFQILRNNLFTRNLLHVPKNPPAPAINIKFHIDKHYIQITGIKIIKKSRL